MNKRAEATLRRRKENREKKSDPRNALIAPDAEHPWRYIALGGHELLEGGNETLPLQDRHSDQRDVSDLQEG